MSRLLSPAGLLVTATLLAALYGAAELLGLRAHTCVISGSLHHDASVVAGLLYTLLHFGTVVLAPVLALAALLQLALLRGLALLQRRSTRVRSNHARAARSTSPSRSNTSA